MAGEDYSMEGVGFSLEPFGARKNVENGRDLGCLVGFGAQPNARVQGRRKQVIDHVETFLATWIIHSRHIGQTDEAAIGIIAQVAHDLDDFFRPDRYRQLIEGYGVPCRGTWKRANNRLPQSVEPAVVHSKNLSVR